MLIGPDFLAEPEAGFVGWDEIPASMQWDSENPVQNQATEIDSDANANANIAIHTCITMLALSL